MKTFKSLDERGMSYGSAYVIGSNKPDYLVGRVLTVIEAIGLPEKQEKSLKDILRQEIYSSLGLETWISGSLHTIIKELHDWCEKNPSGRGTDTTDRNERFGFMDGEIELIYKE